MMQPQSCHKKGQRRVERKRELKRLQAGRESATKMLTGIAAAKGIGTGRIKQYNLDD